MSCRRDHPPRAARVARAAIRLLAFGMITVMSGCTPPAEDTPAPTASPATAELPGPATATSTSPPTAVAPTDTAPPPSPTATRGPDDWQSLPVVPAVTPRALEIYRRGLELGANPAAYSKIGDCESTPTWFLGDFDRGPSRYRLGEHTYLQPVIEYFAGSHERTSLAAGRGFNASSVITAWWADPSQCQAGESPLACELRVHRPSLAFIMLGTNDRFSQDVFEQQMRAILDTLIEQGVVPILSTKADNLEGDGSINRTLARLALEYDLPLWNFWLALQPLPDHGLQQDGAHITWARNHFDDPLAMQAGWPVRNLTALQTLDSIWRGLTGQPASGG